MVKKKRVKIIRRKDNFLYKNFKLALAYLKESKSYIWFSFILFILISIFGYFFPIFFKEEVMQVIENLVNQTAGLNGLQLIAFIIKNNMMSSFYGLILGIFLGIIPLGIIIINGYILGFVANKAVDSGGILILWKLFPHGIFEIPAVMISIGLGLKLGMFLFVYHKKNKGKEFFKWIIDSIRVFFLIVIPLLVIAGIIEGSLIWFLG
jgi:stage II sporulation protein M